MKLRKLAWILLIPLVFSNCEDDPIQGCMDELAVNYNSEAELQGTCTYDVATVLQSSTWIMESVTGVIAGSEIDLLAMEALVPTCTHDNLFLFHEDNTVTMDDNLDICEEGEESLIDITGTWTVDGDLLTIVNDGEVFVLTVSDLSSTYMELSFDYDLSGTIVPAVIRLVAN